MERVKDILDEHRDILDNYPSMPEVGVGCGCDYGAIVS